MNDVTLYLHIGLHKTGTSALQNFLHGNAASLLRQDCLYPVGLFDSRDHNPLCWRLVPDHYLPPGNSFYRIHREQNHWPMLHRLIDQSGARRVIVSGEDFCLIEKLDELAEACARYDTRIVVYLRRQDQYLQALYNQMVKSFDFRMTAPFDQFLSSPPTCKIINYDEFLEEWSRCFGAENISVGIYDRFSSNDDLVSDFAVRCGVRVGADFAIPGGLLNSRLPRHVLEAKRILNRIDWSRSTHDCVMEELLGLARELPGEDQINADHQLMSPRQSAEFLQAFAGANRRVAQRFLDRNEDPFPQPGTVPTDSGEEGSERETATTVENILLPLIKRLAERAVGPDRATEAP